MFVSKPSPSIAPLPTQRVREEQPEPIATKETPFATSTFEPGPTTATASYYPTRDEVNRPTPASVVNITNGERQPLNPAQMSGEQGVAFVQQRLAALGFQGSLTAGNSTSPSTGPFRIDYAGDDRRHWDIGGMNVGLVMSLYANNPPEVADRMLAADMKYARSTPAEWEAESVPQLPAFQPMRLMPGVDYSRGAGVVARAPAGAVPTQAELDRPTSAVSVNILTGERTPLNPRQMSTEAGIELVKERLAALG